ncbi:(d)CMP kinase [Thermanaerothrix sp. 4228-RoL]|uniref:Cytidylate kinase n=1 Tax=Thermanaerothrix solaris TaxID=3058434 RepID=A0ABU3NKU0_9CHLR|nr:(d)CMP kinase [Thermanaerothrix sp. 4228-RoL]MDT8897454.1 (d)CMP kinase [Thermanaerothrix sp. 4228-RoL]
MTIAIDGPAASGKSTVGERLAKALGYLFFDTGVMYRAVTWVALQRLGSVEDEAAVTRLAEVVQIDVQPPSQNDGRQADVWVDGDDVTWAIRRPEVDQWVSRVAAYPGVRQAMTQQQRRIGLRGKVVMIGRDITTVVLPEAEAKIYLDASVEERARRRYLERKARGEEVNYEEILESLRQRDHLDSTREVAPLRVAPDAIVVNTDGLSVDEVVQKILAQIN